MVVSTLFAFYPYLPNGEHKPKAGQDYLVVRPFYAGMTKTEVATYMHCTFADNEEEFQGFAQFEGSQAERDRMEVYGLDSRSFKLLDNVTMWAPIPYGIENYLDLEIFITDADDKEMKEETELARKLFSSYLQHYKVRASVAKQHSEDKEIEWEHDPALAAIWDNAFEMVMAACFGELKSQPEGVGLCVKEPRIKYNMID